MLGFQTHSIELIFRYWHWGFELRSSFLHSKYSHPLSHLLGLPFTLDVQPLISFKASLEAFIHVASQVSQGYEELVTAALSVLSCFSCVDAIHHGAWKVAREHLGEYHSHPQHSFTKSLQWPQRGNMEMSGNSLVVTAPNGTGKLTLRM